MRIAFSYEIERELFDKIPAMRAIEARLAESLGTDLVGSGVKEVAIGLIAVENERSKRYPVRKPRYRAGRSTSKELGVALEFEDTLEFDIKTSVKELRNAKSEAQLAAVIRRALGFSFPALLGLKIDDFDAHHFVTILDQTLREIETHSSRAAFPRSS